MCRCGLAVLRAHACTVCHAAAGFPSWVSCVCEAITLCVLTVTMPRGAGLQYADVLYTIGGAANYRNAHSYYAAAVDLSDGENVRALYGLCAAAAQLNVLKDSGKACPRANLGCQGVFFTQIDQLLQATAY